jgi:serine/threonine protein kinase
MVTKTKNNNNKKYKKGRTQKKRTYKRVKGGKPIKSGSYGCVFKPVLKCDKNKYAELENGISKLMDEDSAKIEFDTIVEVQTHIKGIPNNNDYFLVNDIKMCAPDKLSNEDLNDFDAVCNDIVKYTGYDKNIINNNLKHFKIINMPYGGIDLNEFWKRMMDVPARDKKKIFGAVNSILIRLLENGIIPLNQTGFYHLDVKGGNILVSDDIRYARLIDWGVSQKLNENNITPSKFIQEFQFNIPFTNILFNLNINKWIQEEFTKMNIKNKNITKMNITKMNKKSISLFTMKQIVKNVIDKAMKDRGEGHYMVMLYYIIVLYNLDDKLDQPESTNFASDLICTFIATALMNYTDSNGVFQLKKYCLEVYLRNVDVWGFIMSYIQIIIYAKEIKGTPKYKKEYNKEFIKAVSDIIINYCYNPKYAISPIPVDKVIADLLKIKP